MVGGYIVGMLLVVTVGAWWYQKSLHWQVWLLKQRYAFFLRHLPREKPTIHQIADAVWDEYVSNHVASRVKGENLCIKN